MKTVRVGDFVIGERSEPFFIAELGICHGGDVDTALRLAEASARAGAHCVKTETFQRETVVLDESAVARYIIDGQVIEEPLSEHMKRYELTLEEHHRIKLRCDELGVPFMSTAHDFEGVDFLVAIKADAVKIASPDIVHYPLLRHAAQSGLAVFLDTGAALQYEVERAVEILRQEGAAGVVVNHNPAGHPAQPAGHDLRIIPRLAEILEAPIGISDHYERSEMLYAAVALGALVLEKPVSEDPTVKEPERNWSVGVDELSEVITNCRAVYQALGSSSRQLSAEGKIYRNNNRSCCAVADDLPEGTVLGLDNVVFGRPRMGIAVEHWDLVNGRRLRRAKAKNDFLQWEDLD
ncbi:N-acetylneuraminate synthase family protein [Salidesulfovibrio onnuriiensis]|uniref:N-acetylneuraminate synthase family protein n=1 Tax=Salidesulfovibrio onnuriiensis TaxID=2583823 RepID=UPI0011CC88B0|nr:N-acetylneuraminate synthase family protein [Salidesulfovibrio onnuriiensis]